MSIPLPQARKFVNWALLPPRDFSSDADTWSEPASIPLVRELLRRHAEIASYGTRRFSGTRTQKNAAWYHYRNFLRQGISNFDAAMQVPNRSACLLYYYALLNFAKAELLDVHSRRLVDRRIHHGLTFNVTRANTIAGDRLHVNDGVFRLLYERRVGRPIPSGELLPIKRLLANIPELATQLRDADIGKSSVFPIYHLVVTDMSETWPVLLSFGFSLSPRSSSGKVFFRNFREVQPAFNWRDIFGLTRRAPGHAVQMFESIDTVQNSSPDTFDVRGAGAITWRLKEMLTHSVRSDSDAWVSPSLYQSKLLSMPASLARYSIMFYASSLVRYRPSMFDSQLFPEQAYLFDAIARECALPILIDVLSGLEGKPQMFLPEHSFRP